MEGLEDLGNSIDSEEIRRALFSMGPWKALGPDGFPVDFFQQNWEIVGDQLCSFVQDLWRQPGLIAKVNATYLCLIPKVAKVTFITRFRSISLSNVTYKLLTKVIVNRLKPFLPSIITVGA